jgi:hypothetical protein
LVASAGVAFHTKISKTRVPGSHLYESKMAQIPFDSSSDADYLPSLANFLILLKAILKLPEHHAQMLR